MAIACGIPMIAPRRGLWGRGFARRHPRDRAPAARPGFIAGYRRRLDCGRLGIRAALRQAYGQAGARGNGGGTAWTQRSTPGTPLAAYLGNSRPYPTLKHDPKFPIGSYHPTTSARRHASFGGCPDSRF